MSVCLSLCVWHTVLHCAVRMRAVMVYLMRFESAFSCSMRLMRKFDLFFLRIVHYIPYNIHTHTCTPLVPVLFPLLFLFLLFTSVTLAGCGILSEGQLEKAASLDRHSVWHSSRHKWPRPWEMFMMP